MALSQTLTTRSGFVSKDSYISISSIKKLDKVSMNFSVNFRKDKESEPFNSKDFFCAYDIQGNNPIYQAYAYLKTLPEFAGAIDC